MGTPSVAADFVGPLRLEGRGDLADLRQSLAAAGFNQSKLIEMMRLGGSGPDGLDRSVSRRRTSEPTAFNTLFRLFVMGESVSQERLKEALGGDGFAEAAGIGLFSVDRENYSAQAKLLPFNNLWVLGDFRSDVTNRPLQADHVLGAGAASATLAALTPRGPVESMLDLGCGSGVQSFAASGHARCVVATDINDRALNFATVGAALNGCDNIQFRKGSMFDPVEGEQFDLIVSNPPFVISPESRFAFRDGPAGGDSISEQLIGQIPDHLRDGGRAVLLFNWHHGDQDDWFERPTGWMAGCETDAWLIRFHTEDPLTYAAHWLRPTHGGDPEQYEQLLGQWIDYYKQIGARWISAGAVIIRKNSSSTQWRRHDTVPEGRHVDGCGEQIDRIMDSESLLASLDNDEQLLDLALRICDDHRLEHILSIQEGRWVLQSQKLRQTRGFTLSGQVDQYISGMLTGCNGRRPLRQLVDELAQQVDEPPDAVTSTCLKIVKKLMRSGVLYVQAPPADHEAGGL